MVGQKAAQRAEATQQKLQQRAAGKHSNTTTNTGPTNVIQQPDKSKKTK
jgi:hypothetical protein